MDVGTQPYQLIARDVDQWQRGVTEPAASLIAETGLAISKVASARWISETGPRTLSQLFRESLDDLKAVLGP